MRNFKFTLILVSLFVSEKLVALSNGDVDVRMISGYLWLDNACTAGGPQGKVVSFRIRNTKGSLIQNFKFELTGITFTPTGGVSYTSGTPSFTTQTSTTVYLGDIPAGDSVTAFFFVGYNCLMYPNNTNLTTDVLTFSTLASDNNSGSVNSSFNTNIYVLRNANNNTISIVATSTNTIGTLTTFSVAYSISNVKPGNIIDMELSTLNTFPSGYEIVGCKITSSSITGDFPVNLTNTHYSQSIISNLPSGGTVTIEWYLKITNTNTGLNSSNLVPFIVSDAGSAQRWQANTTAFTGTSTPTNPITMTKRASRINNLISDTVTYTIVLHNSSLVADVTIDRLVDKLPRDFQFRYIETDTNVYPDLVTYSNCTAYPDFLDTNYLFFNGHKSLGGGEFSWVVPKQDSIKLIYSVQVSGLAGLNDTNFIDAYVGSDRVAEAFAKVNVFTSLPFKLVKFNAEKRSDEILVNWVAADVRPGDRFELIRVDHFSEKTEKLHSMVVEDVSDLFHYTVSDQNEIARTGSGITYKLIYYSVSGMRMEWTAEIGAGETESQLKVGVSDEQMIFYLPGAFGRNFNFNITDASGKSIESGSFEMWDGTGMAKIDSAMLPKGVLVITVYNDKIASSVKWVRL